MIASGWSDPETLRLRMEISHYPTIKGSSKRARVDGSKAINPVGPQQHVKQPRKYQVILILGLGRIFIAFRSSFAPAETVVGRPREPSVPNVQNSKQLVTHQRKLLHPGRKPLLGIEYSKHCAAQSERNITAEPELFESATEDKDVVIGGRRCETDE